MSIRGWDPAAIVVRPQVQCDVPNDMLIGLKLMPRAPEEGSAVTAFRFISQKSEG